MSGAVLYPPANRTSQWYGTGNATVSPTAMLWHTTETPGGWPGYGGGSMAPNLTYDPWSHLWRQHFPINGTARALANGPNYQTNRQAVVQVEVSCYCDPSRAGTGFHVNNLDARAYDDMFAFADWLRLEWGIPLTSTVGWKPYPASYGASNGVRLGEREFTAYRGHCAHMHAPNNLHGDSGGLDVARIVRGTHAPGLSRDITVVPVTPDIVLEASAMKILTVTPAPDSPPNQKGQWLVTDSGAAPITGPQESASVARILAAKNGETVLRVEMDGFLGAVKRTRG